MGDKGRETISPTRWERWLRESLRLIEVIILVFAVAVSILAVAEITVVYPNSAVNSIAFETG